MPENEALRTLLFVIAAICITVLVLVFLSLESPFTEQPGLMQSIPEGCIATEVGKLLVIDCGLRDEQP